MEFLCGCKNKPQNYRFEEKFDPVAGRMVLTSDIRDEEGYPICPEHGARKKNWRSPLVQTPNGNRLDHFKIYPPAKVKLVESDVPDLRFNDDPTEYGKRALAVRRAKTNGHSKEKKK